jgi:hypothetical protein
MSSSFDQLFDKVHAQHTSKQEDQPSSFDEIYEKIEKKSPSRFRSIMSALPKGLIKGASSFSPLPSLGPVSMESGKRLTEQFLPTQDEPLENILEFTGENVPLAAMGEGGLAKKGLQALTGGIAKKGAKDLDLPEWAQDVVGGAGMLAPGALQAAGSKVLRPSIKQKNIIDFLKSKGMSDKDITPIIQDKKMLSFLSKGASKYEKKEPWLKGIQNKLGDMFQGIRDQGRQAGYLEGQDLMKFEDAFHAKLEKVPRMYRRLVEKEVEDLFQNPIDFTELHDFNKAINAIVGSIEGGKAAIGILKEPIEIAQKGLSPSLYKDLKMTNEAYSRLYNFTDKMTKKNWEGLINLGQTGGLLWGALTLDPALMATGVGTIAARGGIKQILSNPRLQNIHLKMWDAFLKNNMQQTLNLLGLLEKEIGKKEISNQDQKNKGQ